MNLVEGKAGVKDEKLSGDSFLLGLTKGFWSTLDVGILLGLAEGLWLGMDNGKVSG
jgi:hypothetical protein